MAVKKVDFVKMNEEYANEIVWWEYSEGYEFYNLNGSEYTKNSLVNSETYAVIEDDLIGFATYGKMAKVGDKSLKEYEEDRLDIGFGLRPDLCGKGDGKFFVELVMSYGVIKYNNNKFRLSVASFNKRAIKVYKKLGFKKERTVIQKITKVKFDIMVLN